jgi:PelA/Pel-15E family pectate lyase
MYNPARNVGLVVCAVLLASSTSAQQSASSVDRQRVLDAMIRATVFMVEKVSTNGGYVWSYLPDRSRRWGELEARDTQIWIQPPGTATMGHLFLDAYHATGDEYYYRAAEGVAGALIWAQHPSGGWNYLADFGGDRSLREWYDTVGRNAWRMEEFQHYWGNATFDDAGTAEASKFLLRLYIEKRDPKYKPALDKAIRFVLDSQYPMGAWPQRYPPQSSVAPTPAVTTSSAPTTAQHTNTDYTAYPTFNDDVAAENIDFLVMCYQALGDPGVLDAITRGMNAFLVTQQGAPQPGWALQYTMDLQPAGARTYEPKALATHTTATNLGLLLRFYRLTGDTKFLARIPEALDWLEALTLPPGIATRGGTHPTFIEIGTNRPLYVHRTGSNVVNGRYYVDHDPKNTLGHYSAFRRIDVAGLRKQYAEAKALSRGDIARRSPLFPGAGVVHLPRFFAVESAATQSPAAVIAALNAEGYWPAPLGYNSHSFRRHGSREVTPGDFAQTHVGDESDTSPFPDERLIGISTAAYIRNMSVLIRALEPR